MTVATSEYDGEISHRDVPIKYIGKLAELEKANLVPHEPVVDRGWHRDGTGYTCVVTFRWECDGRWEHDAVHFQMNLEK